MTPAERCDLAREVFNTCYEKVESFRKDHFGADLAYLLGAIIGETPDSKSDWVDWGFNCEKTLAFFLEHFPATHPVWQFIETRPK